MRKISISALVCILLLSGCEARQIAAPKTGGNLATPSENAASGPDAAAPSGGSPSHGVLPSFSPDVDVIEIKEKLFVAQTNDIYINPDDYMGKTIKYEGIFDSVYYEATDRMYCFVIRYGPGCCGFDDYAGFEVSWSGDIPENNDWVEVVGVLGEYEEDGYSYLILQLSSLTVLDERGAEYVFQ
jgi:uncharacterized membrane protein YcgQ (UPF0703/DUF1980 family)